MIPPNACDLTFKKYLDLNNLIIQNQWAKKRQYPGGWEGVVISVEQRRLQNSAGWWIDFFLCVISVVVHRKEVKINIQYNPHKSVV